MPATNIEIELAYLAFLSFLFFTLILGLMIISLVKALEKNAGEIGRWIDDILLKLSSKR